MNFETKQTRNTDKGEVGPPRGKSLDPRQSKFISLYCDSDSTTFANCYKSALGAGFSVQTARNLTHNKPVWYSETLGHMATIEPEHLSIKLISIMNDPLETTQNKLRAIDMLMKHKGMYQVAPHNVLQLNRISIESVLE